MKTRIIKFRAWDKALNKWNLSVEIDCFGGIQEYKYNGDCFYPKYQTFETEYSDLEKGSDRFILCQFTGVLDKNETELYEGDIYHMGDVNIKYVVVWHDSGFIGKQQGSSSYAGLEHWKDKIQVIGNIYENQNLINN